MIKGCPFCNHKSYRLHITITCSNCGLSITRQRIKKVIDDWNKRPREEELLKVIREIVYSGKEPETISSKLDNALILLGKYRGENER